MELKESKYHEYQRKLPSEAAYGGRCEEDAENGRNIECKDVQIPVGIQGRIAHLKVTKNWVPSQPRHGYT